MLLTARAARVNKGLTQAQVAEELGIHWGTYQRMEADFGSMRLGMARKFAEIVGVRLDDLFVPDAPTEVGETDDDTGQD